MKFDLFLSISQTPVQGLMPDETTMWNNAFEQIRAADSLGFSVAWFAESHLSSEVQKHNSAPVIPHWKGEVGLNVDFLQVAQKVFSETKTIEVGSAICNILCNGGPVAMAERVAAFCSLHGLNPAEKRRLHFGFAGGRFDFMNRAYGVKPRNEAERIAWRALKGQVFARSAEIFVRLIQGEVLASSDVAAVKLSRGHFRSDEDWLAVCSAAEIAPSDTLEIPPFFDFEALKIVPQSWRRELLQLIIGSHDASTQDRVNAFAPVQVFNLSITQPEVIDATHKRMMQRYHHSGGEWRREYMPRTTFVFINNEPGLTDEERTAAAHREAKEALGAYWTALEGTLDPKKVQRASNNAIIGNVQDVVEQCKLRFHHEDRLMLWFDFFNHDSERVIRNMAAFMNHVAPELQS